MMGRREPLNRKGDDESQTLQWEPTTWQTLKAQEMEMVGAKPSALARDGGCKGCSRESLMLAKLVPESVAARVELALLLTG